LGTVFECNVDGKGKFSAICVYSIFISVSDIVGIYYVMPPRYILSEKGRRAAISSTKRGSGRFTAVLTVAADGLLYRFSLL